MPILKTWCKTSLNRYLIFVFVFLDLHLQEQRIRDAFIDSLKAKGNNENKIEEIGPARKQSFPRRFIEALYPSNENDEITLKELTFDNISTKESTSKFSSQLNDQGEEETLKDVERLPDEQKIRVLKSIFWGVMGVDPMDTAVENEGEESRISNDVNSSQGTNCKACAASENKSVVVEVSNKGHNIQLKRCRIETTEEKMQTNSSVSSKHHICDLRYAPPVTTKPKTTRAWLKDPHLYKVN